MPEAEELSSEEHPAARWKHSGNEPPAEAVAIRQAIVNAETARGASPSPSDPAGSAAAQADVATGIIVSEDANPDEVAVELKGAPSEGEIKESHTQRVLKHLEVMLSIGLFAGFGVVSRIYLGKATLHGQSVDDALANVPGNPANFNGLVSTVLTANILGTMLIGIMSDVPTDMKHQVHTGIAVGFCGSLTTFSSWIHEAVTTTGENSFGLVMTKLLVTLCVTLVSWLIGRYISETISNILKGRRTMADDIFQDPIAADDVVDSPSSIKKVEKIEKKHPDRWKNRIASTLFFVALAGWISMVTVWFVLGGDDKLNEENKYDIGMSVLFGIPGAYLRYLLSIWLNPKENGFFYGTFVANMLAVLCLSLLDRYADSWDAWG